MRNTPLHREIGKAVRRKHGNRAMSPEELDVICTGLKDLAVLLDTCGIVLVLRDKNAVRRALKPVGGSCEERAKRSRIQGVL